MSILAVEKLENNDTFTSTIRIKRPMNVAHFRVNLYKHDILTDGDLDIDFKIGGIVIGHGSLSYTDINAIPGTYFHGMVKVNLDNEFRINLLEGLGYVEMDIVYTMSNHTTDNSVWLGLVKEPNLYVEQYGTLVGDTPEENVWENHFGIELYEYR